MQSGFETIGNATLVFYDRGRPVLGTDPWLTGTCYYGSWGLERPITTRELEAVKSAEHIWISHGHPDHLHSESLDLLSRANPVLVPDHYKSEIRDFLEQRGFRTIVLRYREWYQLSPAVRCLCLDNENQDAILLVQARDSLIVNLNDSPLCGEDRFIRGIVSQHQRKNTYLAALCAIDADMFNIIDSAGRRVIETPDRLKVGMIWETARKADRLGIGNYVCSSSQHVYIRPDSAWANPYRITWSDIQQHWPRPYIRAIEPFSIVELDSGLSYPKRVPELDQVTESLKSAPDDLDSKQLSEAEWLEVSIFFKRFETLKRYIDFVEFVVGGERRRINLKLVAQGNPKLKGFTFHAPASSLLASIRSGYFDDLLIGNFMQTELHNSSLYPWFTPLVAKLGGNAKVFTMAEWRAYRLHYFWRNPTAYLRWRLKHKADRCLDALRWMATLAGVKAPLKRIYRRFIGDPVVE